MAVVACGYVVTSTVSGLITIPLVCTLAVMAARGEDLLVLEAVPVTESHQHERLPVDDVGEVFPSEIAA